ncbi:acyl-CoA dehydrogenase family protein [Novosphingobium sp. SG720]|uniref:acyl-CoA dehydrogenase family protein n=1 Tax=Novosphingobium sp. SG720 TaxID=2586998 RepID=UPI001446AAAB|nr:acyl-CoA dehydrogenase family protein [Novosphingobium sp. SG720]NKJ40629.1 alkylation response protein AidB-like acyl-CoA dehydrogenase [Novosphingobium sp. SG720]
MNFAFDEDQKSLGDTVARLLADHEGLRAPDLGRAAAAPARAALVELGLFAMMVPEEQGGAGLKAVDLALSLEALGGALAPAAVLDTLLVSEVLAAHGTAAQRDALLPLLAAGELRVAIAVTEEGGDDAPATVRTRVAAERLTGSKLLVREAADVTHFAVIAQGAGGPGVYLVAAETAGVAIRDHEDIDPSAGMGAVSFDDVALDADALVGPGDPLAVVERLFDGGAAMSACLQLGIAARMLDTAVEYARTRVQFGKPIGSFQALKHRCADLAVAVEAARSATYHGIWAYSEDAPDRARAVSMAKAYAGEVVREVCNEAIQIHGGMGFTWELGLHRYLRRAKVIEHAFGAAIWHNERILVETLRDELPGVTAVDRKVA